MIGLTGWGCLPPYVLQFFNARFSPHGITVQSDGDEEQSCCRARKLSATCEPGSCSHASCSGPIRCSNWRRSSRSRSRCPSNMQDHLHECPLLDAEYQSCPITELHDGSRLRALDVNLGQTGPASTLPAPTRKRRINYPFPISTLG